MSDPCPGSTYLTAGASWHVDPVRCVRCGVPGRVAVWTGTGHECRRCHDRAERES